MELNQLKDIRNQQYLMDRELTKMYSPYEDTDKDGVINMLDCYPFDKNRHGVWSWIKSKVAPKKTVTKTYIPAKTTSGADVPRTPRPDPFKPQPSPFTPSGGGGGGSSVPDFGGQGGSYVDPDTGKGYEVSPEGKVTEVALPTSKTAQEKLETGSDIVERSQQVPLGAEVKPKDERSWVRKTWEGGKDIVAGSTALPYIPTGIWGGFGASTSLTAEEFQRRKRETTKSSIKPVGFGGVIGFGGMLDKFQISSMFQSSDIRKAGRETLSVQEQQTDAIKEATRNIEKIDTEFRGGLTGQDKLDIAFGGDIGAVYKKKEGTYEVQVNKFNKDAKNLDASVKNYEKKVESFNKNYGGGNISQSKYNEAVKKQKSLEAERIEITNKQNALLSKKDILNSQYEKYKSNVSQEFSKLKTQGIETQMNEKGEITFTSGSLKKKIAPIGFKLLAKYEGEKYGKLKQGLLIGTQVVETGAKFYAGGYALGGTGVLPSIGGVIAKGGKVAKVGSSILGGGLAVAGIGAETYTGYQYGKQFGVQKIGAVTGALLGTSKIGGFVAGGYSGSKFYFQRQAQKTLTGQYTKGSGSKKGKIIKVVDRITGETTQKSYYETKVKGTNIKVKTGIKLTGKYEGNKGKSFIEIMTKVQKGQKVPKYFEGKGELLESSKWAKARIYTKPKGGKVWYKQDAFIKRNILSQDIYKLPKSSGLSKGEVLRFGSDVRLSGGQTKIKNLPENYWTKGEVSRFLTWKGKGAVVQGFEWAEAKPTSTFFTKQVVLYKTPQGIQVQKDGVTTTISQQQFKSLFSTKGASNKVWKELLSKKVFVIRNPSMLLNKKAQAQLFPQLQIQKPKVNYDIGKIIKPSTQVSSDVTKGLAIGQLKTIGIGKDIIGYGTSLSPYVTSVSAGIVGAKNVLDSRSILREQTKLRNIQRTTQINNLRNLFSPASITTTKTRTTQIQRTTQVTVARTTPPTTTTATTIIPPLFTPFGFTLPFGGGRAKTTKQRASKYTKALKRAYQPSVGSVVLGIKAKKKPLNLTGLELRPVISKRKTIKRKKTNYLHNVNKILGF